MSIFIFLFVLFILVLVHELGHFAVAKLTNMRVDEFGVGFPPKLYGIKKGETEYTFNLFPIGGFVKIFGEDDVFASSAPTPSELGDRRSLGLAEAEGGGENGIGKDGVNTHVGRSFTSKSRWAQAAVLLAGVTMNVLFAWVLVTLAFSMGVQATVSETEATPNAKLTITSVLPDSPASDAQILPGSVINGVQAGNDSLTTFTPSGFSAFVESHTDMPLTLVYTYKNEPRVIQLHSQTDIISEKPDQHAIGVALSQVDTVRRPIITSIIDSAVYVVTGLRDITVGLVSLLYDAIRFKADFSQIAGPIGIAGLVGEASAFGITALLMFTALISLNLAVINVLPFPALDGGRLMFVIVEAIKGSPITPKYVAVLNSVGFLILIALMIAVTWNDISRLI